jgi:ABC-type multidrug transport system fused ATPase/permease subunit
VIPQDPILFSGTVRSNLDPFGEYSEFDMMDMLDKTRLKSTGVSLDHSVSENGSNLSVGQRQLICISRALLAKHPIVVMDEATASVDSATDTIIQTIIREGFSQCTVLTIAHRLNTILDSDRVIVVNEGCIAEFDEPSRLLKDNSTMFYSLVNSWETSHQNNKQ